MSFSIIEVMFFAIPVVAALFFVVSLICFCHARRKNKLHPGSFSHSQILTRKILLIVSSVILGLIAAIIVGLVILLYTAVAFM